MTLYYDGVPYVDPAPGYKPPARAATTGALPASTYAAGVLTANAVGALPAQDGVALALGDRLLVKNQATGSRNGLYTVTALGSGAAAWQLTRALDSNASADFTSGELVVVQEGATLADSIFELTTNAPIVLDTTALVYAVASVSAATPVAGEVTGTLGATLLTGPVAATVPFNAGLTIATTKKVSGTSELLLDAAAGQYVAVQIGGAEKARVTSTGGLAIGTTVDPGAGNLSLANLKSILWLNSGGAVYLTLLQLDNGNVFYVGANLAAGVAYLAGASGHTWHVNAAARMRLTTGGELTVGGVDALPGAGTVRAPSSAAGVDQAGSNLTVAAGPGTGAGTQATLTLSTPTVGAAGAVAQTATARVTIGAGVAVGTTVDPGVGAVGVENTVRVANAAYWILNAAGSAYLKALYSDAGNQLQLGSTGFANATIYCANAGAVTLAPGTNVRFYVDTNRMNVHQGVKLARTNVADAAYITVATDCVVEYGTLTASRGVSLVSALFVDGSVIEIGDMSGNCAAGVTITITPTSGTINGAVTKVLNSAYAFVRLRFNGTNWFVR